MLSADKALQEQKLKNEKNIRDLILIVAAIGLLLAIVIINNINRKRRQIQFQKNQIDLQKLAVEKAYQELQATQTQLVQREKMASLGELTAGIAHEIQNPLNFVTNFSELSVELLQEIQEGPLGELPESRRKEMMKMVAQLMENLEKISHHGKRADAIVKGMLQHSRTSTGKKEPANINALAEEYGRMAFHGFKLKNSSFEADLHLDLDPDAARVNIIPAEIGRVLLNLLNNAYYSIFEKAKQQREKFLPAIWVSTHNTAHGIQLKVKDNGMGISPKNLDKIFHPFFTTKPTGEGTGLGLSLSYDVITKAHGGQLTVRSQEGEFAEFIILLPFS